MGNDVGGAFGREPSSPYVAYLQDSRKSLNALIFLAPVLTVYHVGIWFMHTLDLRMANGADVMLAEMLNLLYIMGLSALRTFAPEAGTPGGLAEGFLRTFSSFFALFLVVFILLLKQHWEPGRWRFRPGVLFLMFLESALFALPLFAIEWLIKYIGAFGAIPMMAGENPPGGGWAAGLVLSMGAGVYEEFLFRMLLMGLLFYLGKNLCRLKGWPLYCLALGAQALSFAGFHYLPWSNETWVLAVFVFRVVAGLYFGYLYQERGLGIAAGAHVLYDIGAVTF